jgi:hypothetical protein
MCARPKILLKTATPEISTPWFPFAVGSRCGARRDAGILYLADL